VGKFLLVVVVFAALVYAVFYLVEKARAGRSAGGRRPGPGTPRGARPGTRPGTPPRRTLAPDDDEEFLRDLNRRRRKGDSTPPD
jgi:hypothetical protein